MRALILAFALAGCSPQAPSEPTPPAPLPSTQAPPASQAALAQMPSWESARAAGVDFRAVGQEPGWMVDVYTQGRIVALMDYGQTLVEFPAATLTNPAEGATRFEAQVQGHTLSLTARRAPCEDAMSGAPYPATVEVVFDGRTLNGCGKSV
ncbi:MAG: hypothetical protein U1E03_07985 [Hyphomonadaceae bacterium]